VYQYDLTVLPDHMSDSYIMQGVFKACKKKADAILGLYIQSGRNVFTTTNLEETVTMNVKFREIEYTIIIDAESKKYISGKNMHLTKMEDHSIVHTLLNIIVK
jgi:Leu/Phe-tRNA-protein transferase